MINDDRSSDIIMVVMNVLRNDVCMHCARVTDYALLMNCLKHI